MSEKTEKILNTSSFSCKRAVLRTALFLCCCVLTAGIWLGIYGLSRGPESGAKSVIVEFPPGTSLRGIGTKLAEAGVVYDDIRFALLTKLFGYGGKLKAGEFKVSTGRKPLEIIRELAKARPVQHAVTIPEGLNAREIGRIFAEGGWCDHERFERLAADKKFIAALGFGELNSLEGYLFPDTYHLTKDIHGEEELIRLMTKRFREVLREVSPSPDDPAKLHDIVILASMVEKETAKAEERPVVAGVFYNRLKKGMRLQSDPTVIYGMNDYSGNISRKDLQTPSSYNTYTVSGLPAGPISNPGREALRAALQPAETEYLFFVGKNDGSHQFSRTLDEHNQAVQKYQRKKSVKNGKG